MICMLAWFCFFDSASCGREIEIIKIRSKQNLNYYPPALPGIIDKKYLKKKK